MSDSISFDFSEVNALAADLGKVPGNAGPFINSALQHTAVEVKKDAAKTVGQRKHFKQAAASIDYDVDAKASAGGSSLTVEIGYNKAKDVGKLGNLVEFGSPGNPATNLPQLPPGNDLANALEKQTPDFQSGLEKALRDAEAKSGL